jgi:iron(III) transport system substrate-binding protein
VGTSARSRVLVYNTRELTTQQLPTTVWALSNPRWKGKIGIAPTNASFQAFLGATIHLYGEDRVRDWLRGLEANNVRFYPNNTTVVQAVARGDVLVGLVNHYYLHNLLADNPALTARNHWFRAGDPGNLVLAAGVGIVSATKRGAAAQRFVDFLHSRWAQRFIARGPGAAEYPVIKGVSPRPGLPALKDIKGPTYPLGRLSADLPRAVEMLLEVGFVK